MSRVSLWDLAKDYKIINPVINTILIILRAYENLQINHLTKTNATQRTLITRKDENWGQTNKMQNLHRFP